MEPGQFGFRGWHGPPRFAPYTLPTNHRLNYMSMPSRCSPQSTLQYHTLPSSVEYSPHTSQNPSVDWGRASYVGHVGQAGPYSPYPDDEESSHYTAQPPSFILPNTDPMSTNNTYYIHGHAVRPHPTSLWPESQHYVSQPSSHLTGSAYAMASEGPHAFHTGTAGHLPSDRILPQPFAARSYMPTPASSIDIPVPATGQRNHSYWHGEVNTSVQQLPTPVEANGGQEQAFSRESLPYRAQDVTYGQTDASEGIPATGMSARSYLAINEPQPSGSAASTDNIPQQSALAMLTPESQKSGADGSAITYGYRNSTSGRSSQLRSASGHLPTGPLYCRTTMLPRREHGSDECSPDCSSCQTTESTRTSFSHTGSGC